MAVVLKQFIDKFKAMEKVANETLAASPEALVGVDSMPGSEHDQNVPEEAKKPDPEVAQGQPAGAGSASGAVNGGDAKPLNEGKLEMDQPLENPAQKPLITDDALTAKTANDHLVSLVGDLLKDLKSTQKQASCGGCATHAAAPSKPAVKPEQKKGETKDDKKDAVAKNDAVAKKETTKIALDENTINKIAAAQAAFMLGKSAADAAMKNGATKNITPESARSLIRETCIKVAQEQGLSAADAASAADNAMAVAGMSQDQAAAADAAAAAATADAGTADNAAAAADTAAESAGTSLPEGVTEEELATAIVDLVQSGELDVNTAKALVEEIAGDEGSAAPTEDQAAEIIAQGLESGEITPEQAQQIAAAVEGGDEATADAAADAEAQGAAAADEAAKDAVDEAKDAVDEANGAALADEAIKSAAERIRSETISKVANAIVSKRAEKQASAKPKPGDRILSKVAGILKEKAEKQAEEKKASEKVASDETAESKFIRGFCKRANELGVDPVALAKYVCESKKHEAK